MCLALGSPSNKERRKSQLTLFMIKQERIEVVEGAGVPGVPKISRCRVPKRLVKCGKADIHHPLKDSHKTKRFE